MRLLCYDEYMILFATILGLTALLCLSVFQLLLILGKPLGDYAWGGQYKILPRKLRIASMASIVLYIVFASFLVSKVRLLVIDDTSMVIDYGMWVITGYFILGIFVNLISRNKKERIVMTPTALVLAVVFFIVARGMS